jgi:hypothetical protein
MFGARLVDIVRVTNPGGSGLQVQQNSDGVMVSAGLGNYDQPRGIGTQLPLSKPKRRRLPGRGLDEPAAPRGLSSPSRRNPFAAVQRQRLT